MVTVCSMGSGGCRSNRASSPLSDGFLCVEERRLRAATPTAVGVIGGSGGWDLSCISIMAWSAESNRWGFKLWPPSPLHSRLFQPS